MAAVSGLWILVTAVLARAQLAEARALLPQISSQVVGGDNDVARRTAAAMQTKAHRAQLLTSGPIWWTAGEVPYLGEPLRSVRGATVAVDALANDVLPQVLSVVDDISPARLRTSGDHIAIDNLERAVPLMAAPLEQSHKLRAIVDRLPRNTWLDVANKAVVQLQSEVNRIDGTLTIADRAAQVIPPLLGRDAPMSYFVALENEAELRGTGGLPGSFGILRASKGTVRFDKFHSDTFLNGVSAGLPMTAEYAQMYGAATPTQIYVNANVSPDFPTAARIWMAMWKRKTGEQLDGAFALDPTAMSYLLREYPPTELADGTPVTADNIVGLTQRDAYFRYPLGSQADIRKQFLVEIADAVSHTLLASRSNPQLMAMAAAQAAGEGRLLLYSRHADVQRVIAGTTMAGAVDESNPGITGLVINNAGGNKLDFYLRRAVQWSCAKGRVTVLITLQNTAPDNLTPYVTARLDPGGAGKTPGSNLLWVDWVDEIGGELLSSSDGSQLGFAQIGRVNGHPIYRYVEELPRGETKTITLRLTERVDVRAVKLHQPGVQTAPYVQHNPGCS